MLSICVNIKKQNVTTEKIKTANSVSLKKYPYEQSAVNDVANAIDAIDDIFTNFANINHIAMDIEANRGERTRKMPADVATPFPPLNPNQIGYTCPIWQQKTAERYQQSSENAFAIKTNSAPFKTSPSKVHMANVLPPLLKMFVAPVLCDPTSLTSICLQNFINKKPVGIEPIKYPRQHNQNKFIIQP